MNIKIFFFSTSCFIRKPVIIYKQNICACQHVSTPVEDGFCDLNSPTTLLP